MFLVDLEQGRIVDDEELKHQIASAKPYGKWLREYMVAAGRPARPRTSPGPTTRRCSSASRRSATRSRTSSTSSAPMANNGEEALGSMGTDTPLAVLSDRPQPLFNYFKQLFAQVTNPPLDAIREELVTSVLTGAGGEGNLLEPTPESCRQIALETADPRQRRAGPAQAARRLARVQVGRRCRCSSRPPRGPRGWSGRSTACSSRRAEAIDEAANLLILSRPRRRRRERAPIPSLLACAGLHHHLVREGHADPRRAGHRVRRRPRGPPLRPPARLRRRVDQPLRRVRDARRHDQAGADQAGIDHAEAVYRYRKAIKKGVVKVMSKMGISTIQSYRGAQIFEAIGLNQEFVDRYFDKTASRIGGVGLEEIARETLYHHRRAYAEPRGRPADARGGRPVPVAPRRRVPPVQPRDRLPAPARHASRPVRHLQEVHAALVDDQNERLCTLRGLFDFKFDRRRRSRSRRSSRSSRSSSGSPPARCPTARSAARRTRPWPSP